MFFLLLLFIIFVKPVMALDEFNLDQNINYQIDLQGNAQVSHQIILINNLSSIYAKEYILTISQNQVNQISAHDQLGNIFVQSEKNNDSTKIYLKFNNPAVGKGQTQPFSLNYQLPALATSKGKTWEVAIPDNKHLTGKTSISIKVPLIFGNLSFSSLPPKNQTQDSNNHQFLYELTSLNQSKILLAFGSYQVFDFNLDYNLFNDKTTQILQNIPLPPDTQDQLIILKEIEPRPQNIQLDPDGNWLASYLLEPQSSLTIKLSGQAKIFPRKNLPPPTTECLNQLLKEQKFWPVSDPIIRQISSTLKSPRQIYDYVVQTLDYNFSGLNNASRKGALEALTNPKNSLCTEFTDLFITLARSNNIPARELEGYAFSNNTKIKPLNNNADVLHAWPQYWLSSKLEWVTIDPTWGKTTNGVDFFNDLDLNHLTFVIHGISSELPPPPGSYRLNSGPKTVNVQFASEEIKTAPIAPKLTFKSSFGQSPLLQIENPNLQSLNLVTLNLKNSNWQTQITTLPPLAKIEIKTPVFSFFASLLPQNQKNNFIISYQESSQPITVSIHNPDHFLNLAIFCGSIIILLVLSGIIITNSKH